MKTKTISFFLSFSILILTIVSLVGCSQPATTGKDSGDLNITEAYQTVDAQLTQSVAQTALPPTKTSLPDPVAATPTPTNGASPELPTATELPSQPTATFLPTFTHTPAVRCDKAEAAYPSIDITIPDDTAIPAGNTFTKVWRVVNTGTCNWTAEYAAVYFDGNQMGASNEIFISKPVAPGQTIDIEVNMVAPLETGTYQGNWMLQNADGELFGIGPNGNDSFWVRILVVSAQESPTPTATSAPEPDVLVSGDLTLNAEESIDLDTLQLNTSGSDLAYQQIKNGEVISAHQFVSLSGVALGVFGSTQPTYADCKATAMSIASFDLEATANGTYYCYTTNQGLTGWARFNGLDSDNGVVTLTILTWAILDE